MQTPPGSLRISELYVQADSAGKRASPFSPNNAVTGGSTELQSDPKETRRVSKATATERRSHKALLPLLTVRLRGWPTCSQLLNEIARVLQSPIPSPVSLMVWRG